ncbi:MAG: flavin reductase family protein, partial [Phycisphaerales bacterium]|nr:flavin reductase family protein [Phycisphaerales bacterium]
MRTQIPVLYMQAFAARPPREVVIAITKDPQGKYNPITLGMFTHVSFDPPIIVIAINLENYSLEAIRHAREFTIALPSVAHAHEASVWGTRSGRDCDKLTLTATKTIPATKIDSVLLPDAAANFECKLIAEAPAGAGPHVVLFAEVIASHIATTPVDRLYILGPGH